MTVVYHSLIDYCNAVQNYQCLRFKTNANGNFYYVDGEWITEEVFDKYYGRPIYEPYREQSIDGTQISQSIITKQKGYVTKKEKRWLKSQSRRTDHRA